MLRFHNTLSGKTEDFEPLEEGKVKFYMCGPTVWSFAHIGNFRTFVFGDVLRRYLKYRGFNLTHVMNLTDVDDRIINESKAAGKTIDEFVQPFITAFWEDFDALGNERPEIAPRATEHITEMIEIIEKLLENGHAYESDGSIYYRISSFEDYGKLSKINFEGNISGKSGRVDTDKYDKENANDFAVWKFVGEDEIAGWDASFGRGRPGWHIECSAMSMKYLGETFDIHGGGIDLKFPHHENEIAQSEGATNRLFSKYWLHAEHLKVEGETMSKSLGNFYTFRDLVEKGHSPKAIRYLLLSVPYHKQLNFTFETLDGAETTIERLQDFRKRLLEANLIDGINPDLQAAAKKSLRDFEIAMDDNLNTSVALAALHNLVRETNSTLANETVLTEDRSVILQILDKMDSVFNIFGEVKEEMLEEEIEKLIEERQEARHNRDFANSDDIRDYLMSDGIVVEDTQKGVRWKKIKEIEDAEKRIFNLINNFSEQKVSGELFGINNEIILPKFNEITANQKLKNLQIDYIGVGDENWWIEVKIIESSRFSFRIIEQIKKYLEISQANTSAKTKIWLVVFGKIPQSFEVKLSSLGVYYSSTDKIEELESLLGVNNR